MGLRSVRPQLGVAKPRLGFAQGDAKAANRSRDTFSPWRAWYRTARWRSLRGQVLLRDNYTCRMCGITAASPELVADHIIPHRGNPEMFWCGPDGLQTLCAKCHGGAKQRAEAR